VLPTRGEALEIIVSEHPNNEPAVMADDGATYASLSAGINNSGSNKNDGPEATQDIYQIFQVDAVRTSNIKKPSFY